MNIYQHFSSLALCNTYLVANKENRQALLIDPGSVEIELVKLIEDHHFTLAHVLLTHGHLAHHEGLGTLRKIYDVEVWASEHSRFPFPFNRVCDGQTLTLCDLPIEAIHLPGHSLDSIVWRIGGALFSGDVLHSGWVGKSGGPSEERLLVNLIEKKLFCLDENTLLFGGHGSPSKLRIERLFNANLSVRSPRTPTP
ncbi:MAG: MBL fold metallo-hydrolase [Sphaerochaeta sp.]|nr:MBL fold metallo-hydrolase [Sphaerochaeta sp.]